MLMREPLRNKLILLGCLLTWSCAPRAGGAEIVPADHAQQMAKGLELFKNSVGALLTEKCVKCHGGEKTKGDLDLTTRENLLKGGAEGAVLVVGKSKESKLIRLIAHTEEPYMPKKETALSPAEVAKIAAWIDAGAPYDKPLLAKASGKNRGEVTVADRQWWSFQPLAKVVPPRVKETAWVRNDLDKFILAKQEEKKLKPNPTAARQQLIRRAYFDLTGLPPTPEEGEAFVSDKSADAYEKLVDHLLASEHYGERWGRHWLDLARFAESHGYEQDYDRPNAYHYRDFVIRALNQDLPYDKFVKWQIAGDEFEPENPEAWRATGFLAAGTHATQITANQAEKERYDELDDLAGTIGTSMLGLTIGCARCHDHKFDPIPTRDYYRLISTFTKTVRSDYAVPVNSEKFQKEKTEFDTAHQPLVAALEKFEKEQLSARLAAWEKAGARPAPATWLVLDNAAPKAKSKVKFAKLDDGSFLVSGENPEFDTFTFTAPAPVGGITAVRLEALTDKSMKKNGPGRADNGNFALSDFTLTAGTNQTAAKFLKATATFEQATLPVAAAIDDDAKSAWAIDPQTGTNHAVVFELAAPLKSQPGDPLTFTLKFDNNGKHAIGRPRLSVTTNAAPGLEGGVGSSMLVGAPGTAPLVEVNKILDHPAAQRTTNEQAKLLQWYRGQDAEWKRRNGEILAHAKKEPKPEKATMLVSSEGIPAVRNHTQGPDFYEKTFFLKRGDLSQKQDEATPGFLQILSRTTDPEKRWQASPPAKARTPFHRATLANWMTDVDAGAGHLLARVMVNRLWQHHFGRGLVSTPSDFGAQGDKPTHPELLDWLAGELIRNGWQLKPVHKLMMTSATYRQGNAFSVLSAQSSVGSGASKNTEHWALSTEDFKRATALDPDNTLYWHRAPQRLEAEIIRDSILAVSGRLDKKQFGPGSLDEGMLRRSVYFTIKRSRQIPMMVSFDAPDGLQGIGRRPQTTVAPQALLLLNNTHVRAAAAAFAKQVSSQKSDPDAVTAAYRQALGRAPDKDELADTLQFLQTQSSAYQTDGKPEPRQRALTDFCQALFGLNEFSYID